MNKVYTEEFLKSELIKISEELGRVPFQRDLDGRTPGKHTYYYTFGTWDKVLEKCGLGKKRKQKLTDYTKDELINYLIKYFNEFDKVPTTRDLNNNKDYPTAETFRSHFGSHKQALIEAGLYDIQIDKSSFDRVQYTKEDVIKLTLDFINVNNRPPKSADFTSKNNLPTVNVLFRLFGGVTNLLTMVGYGEPYTSANCRSDEELITELHSLYIKLGRTPQVSDLTSLNGVAAYSTYCNRFGSFYKSLDKANVPYIKSNKFLNDDEVTRIWWDMKNKLGRAPTFKEMKHSGFNISSQISNRFGGYYNFLLSINETSSYNNRLYITSKGTRCFSWLELKITEWLELNDISFKKDYPYSKIFKDDESKRTLDWLIQHNGDMYYVELFGISNNEKYDHNKNLKIKIFKEHGLNLVSLYPEDIEKLSMEKLFFNVIFNHPNVYKEV